MQQIKNLLEGTIVDVRTPEEYKVFHYNDALNIPLEEIQKRKDELQKLKTPIVFYCRSGNRSGAAVEYLKQQGFKDIYNGGGLNDLLQQK